MRKLLEGADCPNEHESDLEDGRWDDSYFIKEFFWEELAHTYLTYLCQVLVADWTKASVSFGGAAVLAAGF